MVLDKNMAVAVKPAAEVTAKKKPLTKQRRVVVTGMGVVTPVGHDLDVFYNNLLEGVSGISEIEAFDCAQFPTVGPYQFSDPCSDGSVPDVDSTFYLCIFFKQRIAGEIKSFSTDGWVAPKLSKRADKFMLYMLTAGKKALADGGVTEDVMSELDKARCGVLIGSAMGGMKVSLSFHARKAQTKIVCQELTIDTLKTKFLLLATALKISWHKIGWYRAS